jgi:PAS domain S-box-containing protein
MKEQSSRTLDPAEIAIGVFSIISLYIVSLYSYPVFHTISELFSIVIGFGLFMMIWNSRRLIDNDYLLFIGIAYFFVAAIDLVHALTYKGINLFPGYGTNMPTQLWITARYVESLSLLAAPLFIRRKLWPYRTFAGFAMLTSIILISIFLWFFPDCYIDGFGLTGFKIVSEYLISGILVLSLMFLFRKRANFDRGVLTLIMLSIIATIVSELAFTFYVGVYDFFNLIGHFLKIIAFYLVYKAVIETGLSKPYGLLFRNLKQQEESLRASEEWLRVTLSSIGDAVIATDTAGNITFMNVVAEKLTGWKLADAGTKPVPEVFNIINEQTRMEVENPITKALREGMIVALASHAILIRKDGTEVPIDDSAAPIRDGDGKTVGVVLIFRDITEHKRVEEELRQSRIDMDCAQEVGQIGSWRLDIRRNVLTWSDENHRIFGVPKGTPLTYEAFLAIAHPDDRRYVDIQWNAGLAGEPYDIEHRIMVNGQVKWVREKAYLELDDAGGLLGGFGITQDITERKRAEEALQKANTELEHRVQERTYELSEAYETLQREVDEHKKTAEHLVRVQKLEALGTLAGGIAHDFNNILAGIIGFTEMVLEDINPDGPEYKRLGLALKGANRGRDLVKQILTFSRQTTQDRKPLAFKQVVEEGLKLLQPTLPSTIEIISTSSVDNDTVLADSVQMHQILMNLCMNAAHAMREKGGILNISISEASLSESNPAPVPAMRPGKYVELKVSDTGCGMEPEVLERIFDPFFTTKQQGEGTGLGLSVAHGIIKSHGGYVTVESEPGKGTVFHIYLPNIEKQKRPEDGDQLTVIRGKEHILFVDDEDILIELNKQRLSRLGYEVVATTSSTDALDLFRKEPDKFDLVITDYTMPNLTGMDLAVELLKIRATIPIILCTGHSETVSPEQAKKSGIKAFLMKPLAKQELATAIRRVLDVRSDS